MGRYIHIYYASARATSARVHTRHVFDAYCSGRGTEAASVDIHWGTFLFDSIHPPLYCLCTPRVSRSLCVQPYYLFFARSLSLSLLSLQFTCVVCLHLYIICVRTTCY